MKTMPTYFTLLSLHAVSFAFLAQATRTSRQKMTIFVTRQRLAGIGLIARASLIALIKTIKVFVAHFIKPNALVARLAQEVAVN